jgi:hypothetical protein
MYVIKDLRLLNGHQSTALADMLIQQPADGGVTRVGRSVSHLPCLPCRVVVERVVTNHHTPDDSTSYLQARHTWTQQSTLPHVTSASAILLQHSRARCLMSQATAVQWMRTDQSRHISEHPCHQASMYDGLTL